MPSSSWSLQQALYAAITSSSQIVGLLGSARVFDAVPQSAPFPYLTLGQTSVRDWSTGSESGEEHIFTLHVWSRAGGRRETHEIMSSLKSLLHDGALTLSGHRLINLRHELSEVRRDADGDTYHGLVRFRAVTEPLG